MSKITEFVWRKICFDFKRLDGSNVATELNALWALWSMVRRLVELAFVSCLPRLMLARIGQNQNCHPFSAYPERFPNASVERPWRDPHSGRVHIFSQVAPPNNTPIQSAMHSRAVSPQRSVGKRRVGYTRRQALIYGL